MNLPDDDVSGFLELCAAKHGVDVTGLLRQILHIGTGDDPRFRSLFASMSPAMRDLFDVLDHNVRMCNPGLHYVFRSTYMGYRREDPSATATASERSQVFLSVVPRVGALLLVLPVDATRYERIKGVNVVSGKGHHGVGNVSMSITDAAELAYFLKVFDSWLMPSISALQPRATRTRPRMR